jgi:hypothetical protein
VVVMREQIGANLREIESFADAGLHFPLPRLIIGYGDADNTPFAREG